MKLTIANSNATSSDNITNALQELHVYGNLKLHNVAKL